MCAERKSLKTVLLCVVGMAVVMKLNHNPSPHETGLNGLASGEMSDPATMTPGVRGALVNTDSEEDDDDNAQEGEGGIDAVDAALGGTSEGGGYAPPPPPGQPVDGASQGLQQQAPPQFSAVAPQQPMAQQGYYTPPGTVAMPPGVVDPNQPQPMQAVGVPAAGAGYAVGQASTYNQSPVVAGGPVAAGAPLQQVDANGQPVQMAPPPGTVVQAVDANGQPIPTVDAFGQPIVAAVAAPTVDQFGQPIVAAVGPDGQPLQAAAVAPVAVVDPAAAAAPVAEAPPAAAVGGAPAESVLGLLNNFKDAWDEFDPTDTPMFWHIPKAGGSSIKDAMGGCHRFIQATEFGVTDGHDTDTEVAIVFPAVPGVADTDRSPFVNIDSTTVAGIARAKELGFADAHLAQVVVSPFVFETNDLYTQTARGRLFTIFRHPIERAVSMFYYIRVADWEPSYSPEMKDWTIEQYAQSDKVENNWMTRQLSNQLGGDLTDENLNKAMEVVRTKFLVGLMSKIEASMTRFEKAFRWTYHVNPPNQEACRERMMGGGSNSNKANKKPLEEGEPAWDLLFQQNNYDMQLYTYIETLFDEQEQFVVGMPDDFRQIDGTCCKCDPPTFPPEGFTCPQAVKNDGKPWGEEGVAPA